MNIPVYEPYLKGNEKKYVNQCLDDGWISSKGAFIARFEEEFSKYTGSQYTTSVSNGTVALHLALESLSIGPGDEVIVPALTYIASINTVLQTGASVVYVDSLPDTWQIDPADVEKKITKSTKAILVVHLYGQACDMDSIQNICSKNNLLLIEDCAEAFGTLYKGKHVGTFGDAGTFSFFGNKTITTGEGGMVTFKDKNIYDKAKRLKSQGVSEIKEYWHDFLAYNYRMTNICAAIGLAQLEQTATILAKKREIANFYSKELANLPLKVHTEQKDTQHSFWMCSIVLDNSSLRDPLRAYLKEVGIETRPIFYPANEMPHCFTSDSYPIAKDISSRGLNLPSFPGLTVEQLSFIKNSICAFFDKHSG